MARLSKTNSFKIFEDTGIPTPETEIPPEDSYSKSPPDKAASPFPSVHEPSNGDAETHEPSNDELDDERRTSSLTTASTISSAPESVYRTDVEQHVVPMHQPYSPPLIRPSFRRPQSVRRMQMTSPRQSILSKQRSRTGTPRHVRSVDANGSPRGRRWTVRESSEDEEQQQQQQEVEEKEYPLVLLHVSLLPVDLPWSVESMKELLPSHTLENLQLLQSKVSETMLQRGVLIPHPREEYEMLEERLLEVLELKAERVTKCGHFVAQPPDTTTASAEQGEEDSDSALGSSIDGSDGEICDTCHCQVKHSKVGVGSGDKTWSIKVFAANGLMRSSAWAAAWSEMERVDVEILPWIGDFVRRRLDERRKQEEVMQRERQVNEETMVDERVAMFREETRTAQVQQRMMVDSGNTAPVSQLPMETAEPPPKELDSTPPLPAELPQIYRPSQIPLSVLLKNYIYLLAQDRRNIVMFGLVALLALALATRVGSPVDAGSAVSIGDPCSLCTTHLGSTVMSSNVDLGGVEVEGQDAVQLGDGRTLESTLRQVDEGFTKGAEQPESLLAGEGL